MRKLTKAQISTLVRMKSGDEVWTVTGRNPSTFWRNRIADRSPSFATMDALWRAQVVDNYDDKFSGRKYRINDAGRAALEQEND